MQRTALRAAADAERWADRENPQEDKINLEVAGRFFYFASIDRRASSN